MITLAGGEPALGQAGARSHRITWDDVAAARPDVIVCAPCGFDLPSAAELGRASLRHLPDVPVWAVDANAAFTRPGPRLVDGVETLATVLHGGDGPPPEAALRLR
jgi:iron complex transport system substrate-binding protein